MKDIQIDLRDIEEADNGDTTFYGGSYKVGTKELMGHGNDRDNGFFGDLYDEIENQMGVTGDQIEEALDEADVTLCGGNLYRAWVDGSGKLKFKELVDATPKPPSKAQAEQWLRAMGIDIKMVGGQPSVRAVDIALIKKIFS